VYLNQLFIRFIQRRFYWLNSKHYLLKNAPFSSKKAVFGYGFARKRVFLRLLFSGFAASAGFQAAFEQVH
jgi:hypothetical protein